MIFLASAAFALALGLGVPVEASHCPLAYDLCDGNPCLQVVEVTNGDPNAGTYYLDDRNAVLGNGVWLWQESNGIWHDRAPGVHLGNAAAEDLQRGGCGSLFPACWEPEEPNCWWAPPDTLLF